MRHGMFVAAALAIMAAAITSCAFVQRVDRDCVVLMNGRTHCDCRDSETQRYVRCPK